MQNQNICILVSPFYVDETMISRMQALLTQHNIQRIYVLDEPRTKRSIETLKLNISNVEILEIDQNNNLIYEYSSRSYPDIGKLTLSNNSNPD